MNDGLRIENFPFHYRSISEPFPNHFRTISEPLYCTLLMIEVCFVWRSFYFERSGLSTLSP